MTDEKSYRQILRSSSIVGAASVLNILMGLVRMKIAAVVVGPAGIGLIGLLNNLVATAATISGFGFGNVGTRQIAEATGRDDRPELAKARRALSSGTAILALVGATGFWLLRNELAVHIVRDASAGDAIGWLALAVGLTVAASSQSALLNGLRRTADLARITVYSAVFTTVIGVLVLWHWRERGLIAFLLLAPLGLFAVGRWYVSQLPAEGIEKPRIRELKSQWSTLVRFGGAFMFASLAGAAGQLAVRAIIQKDLGVDALGHFQAAWMISMTYIGFVLGAMGTDYYPRLTGAIADRGLVNRLINEQTEVALLLAGPALLAMIALAPLAIRLLYSEQFLEAATLLRWQVLGDVMKVASWPLGFVLLAAGDGRMFFITESLAMLVFALVSWLLVPVLGLGGAAAGFVALYAFYLPLVYALAKRRTGFQWSRGVRLQLALVLVLAACLAMLATAFPLAGGIVGCAASVALAIHSVMSLRQRLGWASLDRASVLWLGRILRRAKPVKESPLDR